MAQSLRADTIEYHGLVYDFLLEDFGAKMSIGLDPTTPGEYFIAEAGIREMLKVGSISQRKPDTVYVFTDSQIKELQNAQEQLDIAIACFCTENPAPSDKEHEKNIVWYGGKPPPYLARDLERHPCRRLRKGWDEKATAQRAALTCAL